MQIVVGESSRNWGFVAGGWASTQLSPRTGDASGVCQLLGTSPGHWTDERVLWDLLPWHRGWCHQHHWALCHGPTVPQPQHCFQAGKHSRRHTGGWRWSVGSFPPCQRGSKTHLYMCTHDWTVPPIMSTGIAWTTTHPLLFVFPGAVLQTITWKLFYSQQPKRVWPCSHVSAGWAGSHSPSPGAHLCPCGGQQVKFSSYFHPRKLPNNN